MDLELLKNSLRHAFEQYFVAIIGGLPGIISGIIERGFFVELPDSKAEGLVDFKYLDDTYTVEEGNLRVTGRRYKKTYKMGDRVQVKIAAVDLGKRQVEMELVD